MTPPPKIARLIEGVLLVDRKAFVYHPEQCSFTRRYHVGESWPAELPEGSSVTVTLIAPGMRRRCFEDGSDVLDIDADVWPKEPAA